MNNTTVDLSKRPSEVTLRTGPHEVNIDKVHSMLSDTYWGHRRSKETLRAAIANSICYSAYKAGRQVGFGRVMTDYATAAYISDVIVDKDERNKGIGKLIVNAILSDPRIKDCYLILSTSDASKYYSGFGFKEDSTFYSKTDHLTEKPDLHLVHNNAGMNQGSLESSGHH